MEKRSHLPTGDGIVRTEQGVRRWVASHRDSGLGESLYVLLEHNAVVVDEFERPWTSG